MTTLSYAVADSATMLRRNLRRLQRYPAMTLMVLIIPIVFLLLFVYVFGGTLGAGLGHLGNGRAAYLRYVTPGILLLTLGTAAATTATAVAMDMSNGIIARFRTMAIARASVLTGHVLASTIQSVFSIAFVTGVAAALGFRTSADPLAWLAAAGLLVLISFAISWLSVALGLLSGSPENASNLPMLLTILPFLGSGFVPTAAMPVGLRWFAEYQPFTPVIQTVRGLLTGGPIGDNAIMAIAWGVGIAALSYLWARRLYRRPMQVR
jgi:ABC-2 type transport system permease protein